MRSKWIAAMRRRIAGFPKRLKSALAGVPLGARLRRAAPVIVVFVLLTSLLESGGWLRSFESAALDTFLLLRKPLDDKHVVIVGITEDDYEGRFGGKSPLDPVQLKEVIDAIAKGNPAVIGVDLDTSSDVFRGLQPPNPPPAVVWARGGERLMPGQQGGGAGVEDKSVAQVGKGLLQSLLPFIFGPDEERFGVSDVLGRGDNAITSGVALVPRDSDGAIRRYRRQFNTWEPDAPVMDAFSWAVIKEYCKSAGCTPKEVEEAEEGWVLNSAVNPHSFKPIPVDQLLDVSQGDGWRGERGPLRNKIVLLGGLYPASRDQHYTATGTRYGVELLAYAVESDLQGRSIRPPGRYVVWFGELLVGFALVVVHARFGARPKRLRYTIVAIPFLALLASLFVFSSLALWAVFLPTLLAVLFQQLHEDVHQYSNRKVSEIYNEAAGFGHDVKQVLVGIRGDRGDVTTRAGDGGGEKEDANAAAKNTSAKPLPEEGADQHRTN